MSDVNNAPAPVETTAPQPVQVVEQKQPSMEETMSAVFDKVTEEKPVEQAQEQPVETPEAAPEESGETPTQETEPETAIEAPDFLPAELRDKWGNVPPEVAEWAAKREAESHKRISELGEKAKAIEPIEQLMEPLREMASRAGRTPAQGLESAIAWSRALDQNPQWAIQELAKAYNVDLSGFAQPAFDGTDPRDRQIMALQQQVGQLSQKLNETDQRFQSREQQETEAQTRSVNNLVEDFAKDKPHWAEIEDDVVAQIHAINALDQDLTPQQTLEKAYERALKLNDNVQQKISADKKKAEEAAQKAEAAKKAAEAKKAAQLNVKGTGGVSPKAKGNWEETMREVGDRLMG